MELDRLILGSNPLSGADHFSGERARERSIRLNTERVTDVVRAAFLAGATGFNFSPNPVIYNVLRRLKAESYSSQIGLYPMLPDTQSYVTTQLNSGTAGMVRKLIGDLGVTTGARTLIQGGLSWLTTDPQRAMKLYLDIEIMRLTDIAPRNSRIRTVLIHEVISDLALALKLEGMLRACIEHLHDKHGLQAGFVTRNFPRFVEFCEETDLPLKDIVLMTPFNKIGFQMTPTRRSCEQTLLKLRGENVITMSLLAGGQTSFNESMDYIHSLGVVKHIAIGVSTVAHARETFEKLNKESVPFF